MEQAQGTPADGAATGEVARIPIRRLPLTPPQRLASTWRQADPDRINAALKAAQQRNPGGWYAVAASSDVPAGRSVTRSVAGREVVFWRGADGALHAGPGACPHLGALLDACPVIGSTLRCRWHGRALTPDGTDAWPPYSAHDDGALVWVQLPTADEPPFEHPVLPQRAPAAESIAAVIAVRGRCEPQDVIANRLDPWHGAWFHPYAFSHLTVDAGASSDELLVVDVTFRLGRTWGIPVRAEFSCPDARTIVMHIVDGEGAGSSVETHATPIGRDADGHPVTEVLEVTFAHSGRAGFRTVRRLASLVRPAMRHTARRLWRDDLGYAERLYLLRSGTVQTS